jgi:pimeloyl-CoA synthetase
MLPANIFESTVFEQIKRQHDHEGGQPEFMQIQEGIRDSDTHATEQKNHSKNEPSPLIHDTPNPQQQTQIQPHLQDMAIPLLQLGHHRCDQQDD